MFNFTSDILDPPIVNAYPGGSTILDKRTYTVIYNSSSVGAKFVFKQWLGFLRNGAFVEYKLEKMIILSESAYALLDQTVFTNAENNDTAVSLIQSAFDTNKKSQMPPTNLSYIVPTSLTINSLIPSIIPSIKGNVTEYTISPDLPPGLSLDKVSGVISGTPISELIETMFTITANNSNISTSISTTITFKIL